MVIAPSRNHSIGSAFVQCDLGVNFDDDANQFEASALMECILYCYGCVCLFEFMVGFQLFRSFMILLCLCPVHNAAACDSMIVFDLIQLSYFICLHLSVPKLFELRIRAFEHTCGFPGEGPWHFASLNVGSLEKHPETVIKGFHAIAFQETRITERNKKSVMLASHSKDMHLSCGPLMRYQQNGVAEWGGVAIATAPGTSRPYTDKDDCTGLYASLLATNRVHAQWISTDDDVTILAFNLYLFSGAPSDPDKHCRNNAILRQVFEVISQHGNIPVIVAGDFQDMPHCYPCVVDLLASGDWYDTLMQQDPDGTISRPQTFSRDKNWQSSQNCSSIDGILVNSAAHRHLLSCEVHHSGGLQHAYVIASFDFGDAAAPNKRRGYKWTPHAALDLSKLVSLERRETIAEELWNEKFEQLTAQAKDGDELFQISNDFSVEVLLHSGAKWKHGKKLRGPMPEFQEACNPKPAYVDKDAMNREILSFSKAKCRLDDLAFKIHQDDPSPQCVRIARQAWNRVRRLLERYDVPSTLMNTVKLKWDDTDLPSRKVDIHQNCVIWGDGSVINAEHFFSKTLGFAVVDAAGTVLYSKGFHDPLGSSYKAELLALVVAVRLRGPRITFVTDCETLCNVFQELCDMQCVPDHFPFAHFWQEIFSGAGFGDACTLILRWVRAHQFDRSEHGMDFWHANNKVADRAAKQAACEACPIGLHVVKMWRQHLVIHHAWLCKLLKLISSLKPVENISEIDEDDEQTTQHTGIEFLKNKFHSWDWHSTMALCPTHRNFAGARLQSRRVIGDNGNSILEQAMFGFFKLPARL
eukprot:Skav214178  [mRNA]  locus=scaffold945:478578:484098:+ [translate_table: standard]